MNQKNEMPASASVSTTAGSGRSNYRAYTLEFKREAVRQVKAGKTVATMATAMQIPYQTLCGWVRADRAGALGIQKERPGRKPGASGMRAIIASQAFGRLIKRDGTVLGLTYSHRHATRPPNIHVTVRGAAGGVRETCFSCEGVDFHESYDRAVHRLADWCGIDQNDPIRGHLLETREAFLKRYGLATKTVSYEQIVKVSLPEGQCM